MFQPQTDQDELLAKTALEYLVSPGLGPIARIIDTIVKYQNDEVSVREQWRLLQYCRVKHPHYLARKLTAIFSKTDFRTEVRESAIALFNGLLADHDGNGTPLALAHVVEYGKKLFSLPVTYEFQGNEFALLKEAIFHLASRIFLVFGSKDWDDLRLYISRMLMVSFGNAMWIFETLPVPLPRDFLTPRLVHELLTRIKLALLEPGFAFVEEEWLTAFAGGHALLIQLTPTRKLDLTDEDLLSLVSSASDLVDLGMEPAVKKGLLDVETYIRRNARRYDEKTYDTESRFIRMTHRFLGIDRYGLKEITARLSVVLEEEFGSNRNGA